MNLARIGFPVTTGPGMTLIGLIRFWCRKDMYAVSMEDENLRWVGES